MIGWEAEREKLLLHILVIDNLASMLSTTAGPAFFRAFIVEDRADKSVSLKFRFKYRNGERNWFKVTSKLKGAAAVADLREGIVWALKNSAAILGHTLPDGAIKEFEPPDDEGEGHRTVDWLLNRDLVYVDREEEIKL